jgi:acyl dehydratase
MTAFMMTPADLPCAADGPFRSTVAHHSLVLALVRALLVDLIQATRCHVLFDLRIRSAEFPNLVSAGRRVRLRAPVVTAAIADGFVEATLETGAEQAAERPPAGAAIAVWRLAPSSSPL